MVNRGVHNLQRTPSVEDNPVGADTRAVERQSTQYDNVAWSGVDVDGVGGRGIRNDAGLDTVRASDGDRLGNVDWSKSRAVDGGDFTTNVHDIVCMLKCLARRPERAGIGVIAVRGNK